MTVRIGVLGAGNIGTAHATDLAAVVSGAEVSVVFDVDGDRATEVADSVGARAVTSAEEAIEAADVDAVLIASPDGFHAEQVLACFDADKPMLCEKPLAVTEADALAIVEAEVARGRRSVQVGFMRRFDPGYVELKAELGPGGIGEALMVHQLHTNTRAPYGLVTEQTLTNMAIHEFDIGRWLLDDDYASVQVITGRAGPRTPDGQHDPILIVLRSVTGVIVQIEAFVNATFGYQVACRISGSEGQAVMGDGNHVTRSKAFHRGSDVPELWLGRFAEAYRIELQGWVDSLSADTPPPGASAWDGYLATLVANRAIAAYHDGAERALELPERPALYAPGS